jgi:hypothetical protein
MIDTDRLDISQPLDLSVICNTGLYKIDPLQKHFGIQLTDEVSQYTSDIGFVCGHSAWWDNLNMNDSKLIFTRPLNFELKLFTVCAYVRKLLYVCAGSKYFQSKSEYRSAVGIGTGDCGH